MSGTEPGTGSTAESSRTLAAGGVAAVALVLLVAGGFVAAGVGPFGAGDAPAPGSPGASSVDNGQGTGGSDGPAAGGDDGSDGGGGSATDERATNDPDHVRPFTVAVESITECGTTCRDVTATLRNNGGNPRESVVVETAISAGEDIVWEGSQELGTFASGETKTRTQRVEIGFLDGAKIEANDGYVTVVTTVRWDGGSATYRERRQVA